ncbi:hypothetical protein NDU88_003004 [Pleurodeles waltl]|uniref:Uncharacterized protein n=1 Tax=Pleurodeles waltl TaxID=8319 RepID=A0AAV7KWB1_PLEWA|nr:hypothetical protein NDU88_003004 [Pleurodeles waltl]
MGGPRLHTPSRSSSQPRSPSRIGRRALSGSRRLQVRGVSAPAVCSVPRSPGVYSALDFRTAGLRALTRYIHAAAPRLPLSMAVGVAAPSPLQFEVLCCRDCVLFQLCGPGFLTRTPSWFSGAPELDRIFFFLAWSGVSLPLQVLLEDPPMLRSPLIELSGLIYG